MSDLLIDQWRDAANDLGLEFEAPFVLVLPSGDQVQARLLLRHFGAAHGMLIVTDYDEVCRVREDVVDAGFGFSTLSEPRPGARYQREAFIEMLRDWGWSGPEALRPEWCMPVEDDDADDEGP